MTTKEDAYKMVQEALAQCTVDKSVHSAVVIIVNNKEETVKVFGLNMDESEVPLLLVQAAAEVSDKFMNTLQNRTLN